MFDSQISGLQHVKSHLNNEFEDAVDAILNTDGKVVLCGVGKSGLIAKKIVATLASTGTEAVFLHPTEALHGDLGILSARDVVILISYSGETSEVVTLLAYLKKDHIRSIAITGVPESSIAKAADHHINVHIREEACPLRLAPMTSTTATLVVGDALAACLMMAKKITPTDFAKRHPGGSLGRKLLGVVADEMLGIDQAIVSSDANVKEIVMKMTQGISGIVAVKHDNEIGIITDGDLRRAMNKFSKKFFKLTAEQIMTRNPICVSCYSSLSDADELMRRTKTHSLLVLDNDELVGILKQ